MTRFAAKRYGLETFDMNSSASLETVNPVASVNTGNGNLRFQEIQFFRNVDLFLIKLGRS